jgi:hypothetical protein
MTTAKAANWAAKSDLFQEKVEPITEHKRRKPFPEKAKCISLYVKAKCISLYVQAYDSLNDENSMFSNVGYN